MSARFAKDEDHALLILLDELVHGGHDLLRKRQPFVVLVRVEDHRVEVARVGAQVSSATSILPRVAHVPAVQEKDLLGPALAQRLEVLTKAL